MMQKEDEDAAAEEAAEGEDEAVNEGGDEDEMEIPEYEGDNEGDEGDALVGRGGAEFK